VIGVENVKATADYAYVPARLTEDLARDGFCGSVDIFTAEEVATFAHEVERIRQQYNPIYERNTTRDRHLDNEVLRSLCLHPGLVGIAATALGPSFVLWRSKARVKAPGGDVFPWHRDSDYSGLTKVPALEFTVPPDRTRSLTIWIAIANCGMQNGGLRFIPGARPEQARRFAAGIFESESMGSYDPESAVDYGLDPGQVMVFDELAIHGSGNNRTAVERIGFTVRLTLPETRIFPATADSGKDERGLCIDNYRALRIDVV
jgi:ectoine hydroxylase-related dioxygenase (phytanoyl-CoA dioxygenase family)